MSKSQERRWLKPFRVMLILIIAVFNIVCYPFVKLLLPERTQPESFKTYINEILWAIRDDWSSS